MTFAKAKDVKAGDLLVPDDGFACMKEGVPKAVVMDDDGNLYVKCNEGRHYLKAQVSQGRLIGLSRP